MAAEKGIQASKVHFPSPANEQCMLVSIVPTWSSLWLARGCGYLGFLFIEVDDDPGLITIEFLARPIVD